MLWIIGTSVSIEEGGYFSRLALRLHTGPGIAVRNLSVGDQTSLMGCMRVMMHRDDFAPGDVVVWEYSLLDTLCVSLFAEDDVRAARRMAWRCLLERGVHLLVLMTPPREHLLRRSRQEAEAAADAALLGALCIDGRALFADLGVTDAAAHYRDDRHPRQDSPVVDAMAARVFDAVVARHGCRRTLPESSRPERWLDIAVPAWRWLDAATIASDGAASTMTFSNSLASVESVTLAVAERVTIAAARRIIGIGIVSTHASGGLWCGHPDCAAVSTRLPGDLGYPFLLRSTTLPCQHARIDTLASAPAGAYGAHVCAAYGQARCRATGPVAVFGLLYEPSDDGDTTLRHRFLCWLRRRDDLRFLQADTHFARVERKLRLYARRLLR